MDLIDRQSAIDALCNALCGGHSDCKFYPKCDNLKPLQDLPSAQPQRLRGRWVETERRGVLAGAKYYKRDICAQPIVVVDSTPMADGYNYCPRCGSQMEEGQDGQTD